SQFPDDSFGGTLRQVAEFVDPVTRTIKVRGDVPNPQHTLKGEMFVTARLQVPAGEEPTVNSRAVYLDGARRYAFVRTDDHTFIRHPLRVGVEFEGRTSIASGLAAGEEAVVSGNLFLQQILAQGQAEAPQKTAKQP